MTSVQTKRQTMQVYAVIGGWDYEGEDFDSLRLFDYHSAAVVYMKDLEENQGYDYSKLEMRLVEMIPALSEIQEKARIAERMALLNTADGITTPW
jgi:hypothetical protein